MERKLGIARCGLACCCCSIEIRSGKKGLCTGCNSGMCDFAENCKSLSCSKEKNLNGCYECDAPCEAGVLAKTKVKGFISFIQKYGKEKFLDCLEKNEKKGIVYHRNGIVGDYDKCKNVDEVIELLLSK